MKKEDSGDSPFDFGHPVDIAWCPGCGNYQIRDAVKSALEGLGISRDTLAMVSGIGQAAKAPHYIKTSFFNGLHGRSFPVATAIKASNPGLTVIVESGDGCTYGEGGNHFMTVIRRNPDLTAIMHNNMVYGLTKGQASPTSQRGFKTPVQVAGVFLEPFNPVAVAVALNASFVGRAFSGDVDKTADIIKKAISHHGFALVDVFQPCVSFNRVNNFKWYKDHTYYLDESHDPRDRMKAFEKATETERFPLGVIYVNDENPTFEENLPAYKKNKDPLHRRTVDYEKIDSLLADKKN
jgi:2-oxoglutarate ferredoxin oxidoreductase subunit beta